MRKIAVWFWAVMLGTIGSATSIETLAKQDNKHANKGKATTVIIGDEVKVKGDDPAIKVEVPKVKVSDDLFDITSTTSDRPPGWDRGNKTGWGDSDVPPGLSKKGIEQSPFSSFRSFFKTFFDIEKRGKKEE